LVPESVPFVITIDGPAGSGKSTVSALLARRLNLPFLTTGAIYRGLAYFCHLKEIDLNDEHAVASNAGHESWKVVINPEGTQVFIDNQNVTAVLNTELVASFASRISAYPRVRSELLNAQRVFNRHPGLVAEGRDCGTVVFPNAQVKIFLTASLEQRALRRSGDDKSATQVEHVKSISARDAADTGRKAAPLTKASDAVEIDTSLMEIDEVVSKIEELVKKAELA
jgi:cytidylate kinase